MPSPMHYAHPSWTPKRAVVFHMTGMHDRRGPSDLTELVNGWWKRTDLQPNSTALMVPRERWQELEVLRRCQIPHGILVGSHQSRHQVPWSVTWEHADPGHMRSVPVFVRGEANVVPSMTHLSTQCDDLGMGPLDPSMETRDHDMLSSWPRLSESLSAFTKRRVMQVSAGDIRAWMDRKPSPMEDIPVDDHGYMFIKTMAKAHHGLVKRGSWSSMEDAIPTFEMLDDRVPMIVSEALRMTASDHPDAIHEEYRCHIIDGVVAGISRSVDADPPPVPDAVCTMAHAFAKAIPDAMPKTLVADFGNTDRGYVLIEINPMGGSGRYAGFGADAFMAALTGATPDLRERMAAVWDDIQKETAIHDAEHQERWEKKGGVGSGLLDIDEMLGKL